MSTKCKECGKTPAAYQVYDAGFIKLKGVCPKCLKDSMGLIKVDNHYVPWRYRNNVDFDMESNKVTISKGNADYYDDIYAKMPKVEWCDKYKKYKFTFEGADFGGYDVDGFEWYFDTKEEIFKLIFGEVK